MTIVFEKISSHADDENVVIPTRATQGSVGYDFVAPVGVSLKPNESIAINTCIKAKFPSTLWLGIYNRSSNIKKNLMNYLGVGVIDSDYYNTDEGIRITLLNTGTEDVIIRKGDAIAQGIFHHVITTGDEVATVRTGGFGSTYLHKYHGRRANLNMFDYEVLVGTIYGNEDDAFYTFVADGPHEYLHDGEIHGHSRESCCWYVDDSDIEAGLLTLIE